MAYAVILAGGRGERFWPKSRVVSPKQVLPIVGRHSMIQETINRIKPIVSDEKILVITNREQAGLIRRQLPRVLTKNMVIEPRGKNTAASVGLGAILIERKDPNGIMVVLPTDHIIKDKKRFLEVISLAVEVAQKTGSLVTIGIKPTYPATGYGYIKIGDGCKALGVKENPKPKTQNPKPNVYRVKRFIEKPDIKTAEKFLKTGRYLWNSGVFVWKVSTILEAIGDYMPGLYSGLRMIGRASQAKEREGLIYKVYARCDAISIDHGIMEKAKDIYVIEADFGWKDIGSWATLEQIADKDKGGNVILGRHRGIQTWDSIIIGEGKHLIGTIGVSDLIVVHTEDATLICQKDKAEDVKVLVQELRKDSKFRRYL